MSRKGSVPHTPARTGVCLDDRKHLRRHLDDDGVRVAVGQEAGQRPAPCHPVAARVVDDDQVGSAGLGTLGREARARSCADDRPSLCDLGPEPLERLLSRHRVRPVELVQAVGHRLRERRVVDIRVELAHVDRVVEILAQRGEKRLVGVRIVEDLALDRDQRDAAERDEQRDRALGRVQLARDPPSQLGALLGRRPHERDRRVVHVEAPLPEPLGHRLHRAEVDHVEGAERDDLRDPDLACRLQSIRAGGEDASDEVVGELRRRRVEHRRDEAASHQRLHRLPTGPGRVEDEDLVPKLLEPLAGRASRTAS